MKEIIAAVDKNLIIKELTPERFLRHTNNGGNQIFVVNYHNSPNTVREIGRLREISFRAAGGGTGLEMDLDYHDTCVKCYDQLIAWSPENEEIIAAYRLIRCDEAGLSEDGNLDLSTTHLFKFSTNFVNNYLPYTIELGRSFVQPKYQPINNNRKGIFSLDNLWDGLGGVVYKNKDIKYLFGKVTMYTHYNVEARDLLLSFMHYYFPDREGLVLPHYPLELQHDMSKMQELFHDLDYKEGHKLLSTRLRELGEHVPPLINTYMNLSSTMKTFGTAINDEFGQVEETGILITIDNIFEAKKKRYIDSYDRCSKYDEPCED